ncbi:hypothetical protein [Chitinophaga sp. S165]|uniref:hypothetical protein n=1 Tax=Chitinophaga sp. S165 TaxID=2135462 RepID=UPI000D71C10C|nr:hypothetical protein [Chitinophaga sp. S165]PWV56453.1 hypothetical protein C7475_101969 [Chitinophaga sp. S165]
MEISKAISAIGIGIQERNGTIIQAVADITAEYAESFLGIKLNSNEEGYGKKLAAAYSAMKDYVTNNLLIAQSGQ